MTNSRKTLFDAERRFQATFEQGAVGIAHFDSEGGWQLVNDHFCQLVGYDREELLQLSAGSLTHPDDRAADLAHRALLHDGKVHQTVNEKRYIRKDGEILWVKVTRSAARNAAGEIEFFVIIVEEITAHKEAETQLNTGEARLRQLQNEFAHLARVNDLGEMAAAIAHEINQPLTAIVNYLNTGLFVAKDGYSEDGFAEAEQMMRLASEQALRAGDIVHRLREFVGQGNGIRTVERAEQLVTSAMALALIDARSIGITIKRDLEIGDAAVEVDKVQIHQVLVNLLRNSVESLSGLAADCERQLTVSTREAPHGFVEIVVADNGPGILPEVAGRLFEPFVTTKSNGMGMGLSVCRRLIESHGGSIEADSAVDQGAAFRIRLPRHGPIPDKYGKEP